jgi:hypothetical protein
MSKYHIITAAVAVLILAVPAGAQSIISSDTVRVAVTAPAPVPSLAPTLTNSIVAVHTSAPVVAPVVILQSDESRSPAMMIVGGAGLIVGAVVGGKPGTMIMIGSGGLGLLGLWYYLQ